MLKEIKGVILFPILLKKNHSRKWESKYTSIKHKEKERMI